MDTCCDNTCTSSPAAPSRRYRRVLWIALIVNASMFAVEIIAGQQANSASLLADAVDFLGDATNYAVSLWALSMGVLWRARTALAKGIAMGLFGVFVLARVGWGLFQGITPHATTMGTVGLLALLANVTVAALLFAYREGDANMRSVWLCSRNDAIGNIAVIAAAFAVSVAGKAWPDMLVAVVMAALALTSGRAIIIRALVELRAIKPARRVRVNTSIDRAVCQEEYRT